METDSTRASSVSGLEVADDIRDADARLVESVVNQLIRWTCDLNGWGDAPLWRLREQEQIDEARPRRDKTLVECGLRFSRAYWQRTYDLDENDLAPEPEPQPEPGAPRAEAAPTAALAEADDTPTPVDQLTAQLATEADAPMAAALAEIEGILEQAAADGLTLAETRARVLTAYTDLDRAPMAELLGDALLAADAAGRADIEDAAAAADEEARA